MKAEDKEVAARATLESAKATRPSGPIAWITGGSIAADVQIQLLERRLRAAMADVEARRIVAAGADMRESREFRAHAAIEAEHRVRQVELQELGRRDLALVDRLRNFLEARPAWAVYGVDALLQHIMRADIVRLAEEARLREEEHCGPQAEWRNYKPRGPTR